MSHTLPGTGEENDFKYIYDSYVDDIYRLCVSFLKNRADAEDAVQETFVKYYCSDKNFESEDHIKAWLIVTASNHCKNILKHWWRKREDYDEYRESVGDGGIYVDEMLELIMKLPDKYKLVVYLHYYEEYDSGQIAKMIHKSGSTVRTYLQKARKILKQELIKSEERGNAE